jgi:hypothetical protein
MQVANCKVAASAVVLKLLRISCLSSKVDRILLTALSVHRYPIDALPASITSTVRNKQFNPDSARDPLISLDGLNLYRKLLGLKR